VQRQVLHYPGQPPSRLRRRRDDRTEHRGAHFLEIRGDAEGNAGHAHRAIETREAIAKSLLIVDDATINC